MSYFEIYLDKIRDLLDGKPFIDIEHRKQIVLERVCSMLIHSKGTSKWESMEVIYVILLMLQ